MPPITLLPGLACDAELWRDQMAALSPRYPVQVADVHMRFATLPQMAEALLAEQPGELLLCGASMGGMLALEVVRRAPRRVKALALLGSTARPDTPEQIRLRSDALVLFEQGRLREVLQANLFFAFDPAHARALAPDYLAMVERAGAAQLMAQNRAVMARADQRPLLPHITCPTLVVVGRSDALTPPAHAQEMAAAIPGARLEVMDECGHMLTWEQPRRVNELLLDWLAGL
ncbi:MAG: alpha/beta fold hydrolase [Rubrivivax sp.]|nr:alpha/beta fold hydrolase [Rubrivivax sp.]